MAIDANDDIYILDRGNDRIVKVDTEGKVLGALYSYDGQWITSNDQIKEADKKSKKIKAKKILNLLVQKQWQLTKMETFM